MQNDTGVSAHVSEIKPADIQFEYVPLSPSCHAHFRIKIGGNLTVFPRSTEDTEVLAKEMGLQGLLALAQARLAEKKVEVTA